MICIEVSRDYTRTPGSRYISEGEFSGEEFRNYVLRPRVLDAMRQSVEICVNLDGTAGYGTSFLEEAFGGLVRNDRIDGAWLLKHMRFVSKDEPYLINDIKSYISAAARAEAGRE